MVNKDAREIYRKVELKGRKLLNDALDSLHEGASLSEGPLSSYSILNTLHWPRTEIIEVPSINGFQFAQYSPEKTTGYVKGKDTRMNSRRIIERYLIVVLHLSSRTEWPSVHDGATESGRYGYRGSIG